MTTTTIYKCDKCGVEQSTDQQMWDVGVFVTHKPEGYKYTETNYIPKRIQADWCRKCVENVGLLPSDKPKDVEQPKPATLEDMVREIAAQQVTDMTGAS